MSHITTEYFLHFDLCNYIFQVTNLCIGEHPTAIDVDVSNATTFILSVDNLVLPQDAESNVLTVDTTILPILEGEVYTLVVSFRNFGGDFQSNSTVIISEFEYFMYACIIIIVKRKFCLEHILYLQTF